MIDSLGIGKVIYTLLGDFKTYPLVADNNAKYPFIVYKRNNVISSTCKDGSYEDTVDIGITIVTMKYAEGIEIADKVREILQRQVIKIDDMILNDTYLISANESFTDNVFVQNLNFRTTITE